MAGLFSSTTRNSRSNHFTIIATKRLQRSEIMTKFARYLQSCRKCHRTEINGM